MKTLAMGMYLTIGLSVSFFLVYLASMFGMLIETSTVQ